MTEFNVGDGGGATPIPILVGGIMHVVVGSKALQFHGVLKRSYESDWDIWTDDKDPYPLYRVDLGQMSTEILNLVPTIQDGSFQYATLDALYTIKCSHLGWDIFWRKHARDVVFLKKHGCQLLPELYSALVAHWRQTHGNKDFLSLYKDKTEFFNDYVPYVYDHDYLHELVAYPNKPVYVEALKENEEVAIDKNKFNALSFDQQIRMFREEITVIALERWIIPYNIPWRTAYDYALRKTVTALTKNWATEFLVLNLEKFIVPEFSYFKHAMLTLKEGEKQMNNRLTDNQVEVLKQEIEQQLKELSPRKYVDSFRDVMLENFSFGDFVFIEQEGGEDMGSYAHTVFQWKGVTYKADYGYQSYDGYNFDYLTIKEVKAVEKTIVVYE